MRENIEEILKVYFTFCILSFVPLCVSLCIFVAKIKNFDFFY
jgi:hypothetical protein